MFIKRFFYKITNREKYLQYKVNTATKRKIEWYKSHFEEKVINIAQYNNNTTNLDPVTANSDGILISFFLEKLKTHDQYNKVILVINFKEFYNHPIEISL